MADDLTSELDEWRRITSQATPGPWSIDQKHGRDIADEGWSEVRIKDAEGDDVAATFISHLLEPGNSAQDEEFIVTARTAMPRLLAALRAVLELAGKLEPQGPPSSALEEDRMFIRQECANMIREVITREITGKGESDE